MRPSRALGKGPGAGVKEARPQSSFVHPRKGAPRLLCGHPDLALVTDTGGATPSGWASFPLPENVAHLTFHGIEDFRFLLLGLLPSAPPYLPVRREHGAPQREGRASGPGCRHVTEGPPHPPAPPQLSSCSCNPDGSSRVTATVDDHPGLKTRASVVQTLHSQPGGDLLSPNVHWEGFSFVPVPVSRHRVPQGRADLLSSPPPPACAADFNGF